jgi:hypothetical protein
MPPKFPAVSGLDPSAGSVVGRRRRVVPSWSQPDASCFVSLVLGPKSNLSKHWTCCVLFRPFRR